MRSPAYVWMCLMVVVCSWGCRDVENLSANNPGGSTNSSFVWQRTNGLAGKSIYSLAINSSGTIYAGSDSGELFRSFDDGATWNLLPSGATHGSIQAILITPLGQLLLGNDEVGILQSTDGGSTFLRTNTGMNDSSINALAMTVSGRFIAGSLQGSIYLSSNGGNTWLKRFSVDRPATSLLVAPGDSIFASFWGAGVFRFTESSPPAQASTGLNNSFVYNLAVNDSGYLFAGVYSDGLYRSTDNGHHWQNPSDQFLSATVQAIGFNSLRQLFAGTSNGVYRSSDDGVTWSTLDSGLTFTDIYSLVLNKQGFAFIGSDDGVFRSQRSTIFLDGTTKDTHLSSHNPHSGNRNAHSDYLTH